MNYFITLFFGIFVFLLTSLYIRVLKVSEARNIIINKRKIVLINEMEKQVYQDAIKNKDFEIYDKNKKSKK